MKFKIDDIVMTTIGAFKDMKLKVTKLLYNGDIEFVIVNSAYQLPCTISPDDLELVTE